MYEKISEDNLDYLLRLNERLELEKNSAKKVKLISNSIKDIVKADRCSVFIHDNAAKSLWSVYIDGVNEIEVPDDEGIVSQVYNTKESIIINDVQHSQYFNSNIDDSTGYITKSIISIPIFNSNNKILGVMQLINKQGAGSMFTKEDEEILSYVIKDIGIFLNIIYKEING